jgi:hypothetical protein
MEVAFHRSDFPSITGPTVHLLQMNVCASGDNLIKRMSSIPQSVGI